MFETIGALLEHHAKTHPRRAALVFENESLDYGELYNNALRARVYLARLGLRKGRRFAILDYNSPRVLDLIHGAALLGCVPVLLNWRLSTTEMEFIIADAQCDLMFQGDAFAEIRPRGVKIIALGNARDETPAANSPEGPARGDDLMQLYTSGTTGLPKGVRTTHANMLALLEQLKRGVPHVDQGMVNLVCAPFFHIAGIGYWFFGLMAGATNVLLRRFEPEAAALAMERHAVSHALLVPAMQAAVLDSVGDAAGERFRALRHILYGAAPISESLLFRASQTFQCDFTQAYGLTETTGVATLLSARDHREILAAREGDDRRGSARVTSAGRAAWGMSIRILRADGQEAAPGESGEVETSGPTVMPGYWRRAGENKECLSEGRLRTGDIGYLDEEGYLYLRDRKKDLIISGGEKIYPIEVERVLMNHPAVRDAAVVGVPDEKYGEAICAFIVTDNPDREQELRSWVRPLLPSYRVPRVYRFVSELPRNPSGKVLRRELRAPFWENRDRVIA